MLPSIWPCPDPEGKQRLTPRPVGASTVISGLIILFAFKFDSMMKITNVLLGKGASDDTIPQPKTITVTTNSPGSGVKPLRSNGGSRTHSKAFLGDPRSAAGFPHENGSKLDGNAAVSLNKGAERHFARWRHPNSGYDSVVVGETNV